MDILSYINSLSAKGRYSFSIEEALADTDKSRSAIIAALRRQINKSRIALPYRGFYLILPPVHQRYGCLPAQYWLDDFMAYIKKPYYVGLLSAATFYAAAHQKPQTYQVMISEKFRSIQCANVHIEFIKNEKLKLVPIRQFNTPSGYIDVVAPEALPIDLLRYPLRSGGLNNIVTILSELAEAIDVNEFTKTLLVMQAEQVILQRLGYLFEIAGAETLANAVEKYLSIRKLRARPLVAGVKTEGCVRNQRWSLYINYEVEGDL